jgi:metallo-beta-lactamase class B
MYWHVRAHLLIVLALASPVWLRPQAVSAQVVSDSLALAPDVTIRRLTPSVWMHTTVGRFDGVAVAANGLLVVRDTTAVLIDTGWDAAQTGALLRWAAESLKRPVRLAVVTHAHPDRLGGMPALQAAHIPAVALPRTVQLAAAVGTHGLVARGDLVAAPVSVLGIELFYPGPGHTADNIVAFVPGEQVLFGGCLVKEQHATDLGNVRDADLGHWPVAVQAVLARYPEAHRVIPGHGAPGGLELLTHTRALLQGDTTRALRDN